MSHISAKAWSLLTTAGKQVYLYSIKSVVTIVSWHFYTIQLVYYLFGLH